MIGGSVTPTVSGKAMSGEATEIAVSTPSRLRHVCAVSPGLGQAGRPTRWGEMTAKAAVSAATVTREVQILGSPSSPGSPASRGRPNSSISGRYGL